MVLFFIVTLLGKDWLMCLTYPFNCADNTGMLFSIFFLPFPKWIPMPLLQRCAWSFIFILAFVLKVHFVEGPIIPKKHPKGLNILMHMFPWFQIATYGNLQKVKMRSRDSACNLQLRKSALYCKYKHKHTGKSKKKRKKHLRLCDNLINSSFFTSERLVLKKIAGGSAFK